MQVRVGADWDKAKCVVAWRTQGKLRHARINRDAESVAAFVEKLRDGLDDDDELELEVGIEAGDRFWRVLWEGTDAKVFVFDGKKARNYAKSLTSSSASDDARSARALLGMLDSPDHREAATPELSPELRGLVLALSAKNEVTRHVSRLLNQLGAFINQYHPALDAEGKILRAHWFLNALELGPTASAWNEASADAKDKAFKGSNKAARKSMGARFGTDLGAVHKAEESAVRIRIRGIVQMLRVALQAEKAAQTVLDEHLAKTNIAQEVREVEGVGSVLAAGITIAFGTVEARSRTSTIPHRDAAAIVLGAAPVTQRSGTMGDAAPHATQRRAVNPALRAMTYVLGLQLVMRHPWAKAAFAHYKAHGKSTGTAFRCLTRSFLRVVGAMMRDKTAFDEAQYINALKRKGVQWAMAL